MSSRHARNIFSIDTFRNDIVKIIFESFSINNFHLMKSLRDDEFNRMIIECNDVLNEVNVNMKENFNVEYRVCVVINKQIENFVQTHEIILIKISTSMTFEIEINLIFDFVIAIYSIFHMTTL